MNRPNAPKIEISAREINRMLSDQIERLCDALGLSGDRINGGLVPRNPTRADRNPGSFVIALQGQRQGRWDDYAVGHYGDALDLVAYVNFGHWPITHEAKAEALRWSKRWLGIGDSGRISERDSARLQKAREAMADAKAKAEALALNAQARDRRKAQAMFLAAEELLPGTHAWRYLTEGRGIDLERLDRIPWAVRSHPAMRHVETDRELPCLIAAGLFADGSFGMVERIFLEPDGRSKLKVPAGIPVKKIWPRGWQGAIIPISRGKTGLAPRIAHERGLRDECAYWEGIENAFTAAILIPEWRISAVATAGNFAHVDPPPCAGAVIAGRDNDRNRKTRNAVTAKVDQLRFKCEQRGINFFETWPERGFKDVNDQLRGIPG